MDAIQSKEELRQTVREIVKETPITDIHSHLYAPAFQDLGLWGIDELLTYHYLIAETMRHSDITYDDFWALDQKGRADLIWETLFIQHSPYSEACRGVLTTVKKLGMNVGSQNLEEYREWYKNQTDESMVQLILEKANVKTVLMTNDPFDAKERNLWLNHREEILKDQRFRSALRVDPLLLHYKDNYQQLIDQGYQVQADLRPDDKESLNEITRFLVDWGKRMEALYIAVSLPTDFQYPDQNLTTLIIDECVVKACRELNIPFAMMIGVKRQVNPDLRSAGDMSGRADIEAVERLCARYPQNRFLVTMLSRENQHELAVLARKFRNLMVFGCWWFLNNPSLIEEITQMRFELLGTSVIPQHSDARILEQLLYKWEHSRNIIADVLTKKYEDLFDTGWPLSREAIQRDVTDLLDQNFWRFVKGE